jgi:hypothetical protein
MADPRNRSTYTTLVTPLLPTRPAPMGVSPSFRALGGTGGAIRHTRGSRGSRCSGGPTAAAGSRLNDTPGVAAPSRSLRHSATRPVTKCWLGPAREPNSRRMNANDWGSWHARDHRSCGDASVAGRPPMLLTRRATRQASVRPAGSRERTARASERAAAGSRGANLSQIGLQDASSEQPFTCVPFSEKLVTPLVPNPSVTRPLVKTNPGSPVLPWLTGPKPNQFGPRPTNVPPVKLP